ncbi:MAG: hypothetical protein K2L93_01675, partial [Muribaculaceae bacterium]|nr:hypothetical protein [Muribaculaceae bacterium]
MKSIYVYAAALVLAAGMTACGDKGSSSSNDSASSSSSASSSNSDQNNSDTGEEVTETTELVAEPEEDTTINGLEPGAQYQASLDGLEFDVTIYKDKTAFSTKGGSGTWYSESVHDKPVVVFNFEDARELIYLDDNMNLRVGSPSATPYKLERINYIPDDAKGMVVGKKYTLPKFRWGKDAYMTLNADGTVTSKLSDYTLDVTNWKKVNVDGKEWTVTYYMANYSNGPVAEGYAISPSLEFYSINGTNDRIKFTDGV